VRAGEGSSREAREGAVFGLRELSPLAREKKEKKSDEGEVFFSKGGSGGLEKMR